MSTIPTRIKKPNAPGVNSGYGEAYKDIKGVNVTPPAREDEPKDDGVQQAYQKGFELRIAQALEGDAHKVNEDNFKYDPDKVKKQNAQPVPLSGATRNAKNAPVQNLKDMGNRYRLMGDTAMPPRQPNLSAKVADGSAAEEAEEMQARPTEQTMKAVVEFLNNNPEPTDADFHAWAEKNKFNTHEAEAAAYRLATSAAGTWGKSVQKGVEAPDVRQNELGKGVKVEKEHTKEPAIAKRIALDHLSEEGMQDYYTRLLKMEDQAKKENTMEKTEEAYVQGFVDKCAQAGVDPEALIKASQITPRLEETALDMGDNMLTGAGLSGIGASGMFMDDYLRRKNILGMGAKSPLLGATPAAQAPLKPGMFGAVKAKGRQAFGAIKRNPALAITALLASAIAPKALSKLQERRTARHARYSQPAVHPRSNVRTHDVKDIRNANLFTSGLVSASGRL